MTITTVFPEKNKGSICYKIKENTGCALYNNTTLTESKDKRTLIIKNSTGKKIGEIPNPIRKIPNPNK